MGKQSYSQLDYFVRMQVDDVLATVNPGDDLFRKVRGSVLFDDPVGSKTNA